MVYRQSKTLLFHLATLLLTLLIVGAIGIYFLYKSQAAVNYDPTAYAEAHVYGYLWGDSAGGTRSRWSYSNKNPEVVNRFEATARALKAQKFPGATVTRTGSGAVQLTNMTLAVTLDRLPPPIQQAYDTNNKPALIAFSTSVIEGEGNTNGMVLDDPLLQHRNAFTSVMNKLGVRIVPSPTKPNQGIAAVQADWPIIQCWPFATYGRVPGGAPKGSCSTTPPPPSDTILPSVTISSPANAVAITIGQTVQITASASDNVGVTKVEFLENNMTLASDTTSPYSTSWATSGRAAGSYTLTAKAYDAAGNVRQSAPVVVTLTGQVQTMPGDVNKDSRVNALDLSILISRDGQNYPAADFNKDGVVGAADLAILLNRWTW